MDFFDLFENNFKVVLPEIYIVLALMFLLMYGVIFSTSLTYNLPVITRGLAWLTMQTLLICCCLCPYYIFRCIFKKKLRQFLFL